MEQESIQAWVCTRCGYVHRGSEPPKECPVCGAPMEDFDPYVEKAPVLKPVRASAWRCLICGHVATAGGGGAPGAGGEGPPAECPVCGAGRDEFEPVEGKAGAGHGPARSARVVVLGGGIAGVSAVEAVKEAAPEAEVVLVGQEPDLPYYRLNLSRYVAGEIGAEALPIHPRDWYDRQGVKLLSGVRATAIDAADQHVALSNGHAEPFDKLIITAGAHAFIPPIPGAELAGVNGFRTLADANALIEAARPGARCVCIGGGILGLELAAGLARRGVEVTVLEGHGWLLPRQLNPRAGAILADQVAALGITVRHNAKTTAIVGSSGSLAERGTGDGRVRQVTLADGAELPADIVVMATGVRPNSHLAREAGLEVNTGIVVDSYLRTSHPNIYAAGDVAEHMGTVYGIWEPARYQGAIAGQNAVGAEVEFGGLPRSNMLKVVGADLFSIGVVQPADGSYETFEHEADGAYCQFIFHDGRLVGAILLGDTRAASAVTKAIKGGIDMSRLLRSQPTAQDVRRCFTETKF